MTTELRRPKKNAACARTWEIEAARDGRLSEPAKASLDAHVVQCAACREEMESLEGLGRALRELEAAGADDVALRRVRQRVLQNADAGLAGRSVPPRKPKRTRVVLPASAFAAALLAGLAWTGWNATRTVSSAPVATPTTTTTTTVDAKGEGETRWSKTTDGETERVDLMDGTLSLRVRKAPNGKRVLVRVPDGEIEDLGTVFHVVVRDGRTERVGVDEGRVTIRLTNAAPITISSGQTWERPIPASPAPVASGTAATPIAPVSSVVRRDVTPARSADRLRPPDAPLRADEEDAAYLRVLQLLRDGRDDEARSAARDYLRRFPDGFRREEMGRIAR